VYGLHGDGCVHWGYGDVHYSHDVELNGDHCSHGVELRHVRCHDDEGLYGGRCSHGSDQVNEE
jgi:hypothetical protein